MLKEGTYAAWFKTSRGVGTGIVHFADGKVWGRDSIISYAGSYDVDGDRFSITLKTKRHTEGHETVFGFDEMELKLEGVSAGKIATCTGTTDLAPGLVLEATLIPHQPQASGTEKPPASPLSSNRLPKLKGRLRAN